MVVDRYCTAEWRFFQLFSWFWILMFDKPRGVANIASAWCNEGGEIEASHYSFRLARSTFFHQSAVHGSYWTMNSLDCVCLYWECPLTWCADGFIRFVSPLAFWCSTVRLLLLEWPIEADALHFLHMVYISLPHRCSTYWPGTTWKKALKVTRILNQFQPVLNSASLCIEINEVATRRNHNGTLKVAASNAV